MKKRMKKIMALTLSCMMVVGMLTACGTTEQKADPTPAPTEAPAETPEETESPAETEAPVEEPAETAGPITIGVSMNSADEFRSTWLDAFTKQAEEKGNKVISTNAESNADKQISDIETLIQQNLDVIVVHAFSADGIVPALDALKAAGIPVVLVDFPVESEDYATLVTDEQYLNGVIQAEYVNDWLAEDDTRVANIGYIVGMYSMEAAMPRMEGFFDTCTTGNKLAEGEGNWAADGAMTLTEDWLQAHPDMNVFVAMSDEMALGCIQALKAAGKDMSEVLVLGIDGSAEGITAIKNGELDCTAARDVEKEAQVALGACEDIAAGKTLEKTIQPEAITALTAENVE